MSLARSSSNNNSTANLVQGSAGASRDVMGPSADPSFDDYAGANPEGPSEYKATICFRPF